MARRNEHSLDEIKAMVLDAAETIIIEQGFAALTIRKIAVEMGYTVGTIYMVFTSRADLILHINARTLEDLISQLQPVSTTADIETWINAYLHYIQANKQRWQMVFNWHSIENYLLPDWYQAQLDTLFQQFAAYFPINSSEQNPQAIQALWQGIQGICLSAPETETDISVLLLLRTFLRGWSA
jgi:AcrR family transcriptional regulator